MLLLRKEEGRRRAANRLWCQCWPSKSSEWMSLHPMGIKLVPYSFLFREERDTFSSRSSSAYDNGTSHRMQLGGNGLVKKEGIFSFVSSFIVQVCRSFIYLTTDCERKLKIGKTKSRYQLATLVNCCLSILFSAITFDGIERNKKKKPIEILQLHLIIEQDSCFLSYLRQSVKAGRRLLCYAYPEIALKSPGSFKAWTARDWFPPYATDVFVHIPHARSFFKRLCKSKLIMGIETILIGFNMILLSNFSLHTI